MPQSFAKSPKVAEFGASRLGSDCAVGRLVAVQELGRVNSHGPMTYGSQRGDRAGQGFVLQPRLREITLQDTSISGYLPSQLGVLTGLQYLDGARARLSGSLPTEIASLTALQVTLSLSHPYPNPDPNPGPNPDPDPDPNPDPGPGPDPNPDPDPDPDSDPSPNPAPDPTHPNQVLYLSENSGSGSGLSGTIPSLFGTNMSEVRNIQLNEKPNPSPSPSPNSTLALALALTQP